MTPRGGKPPAKPAEAVPADAPQVAGTGRDGERGEKRGGRRAVTAARRVVQVGVTLAMAAPLLLAGWGLLGATASSPDEMPTPAEAPYYGSLSSVEIGGAVDVVDPFAALQVAFASRSFDPAWLLGALPVLIVYGLVRGRAFCGWVCPVNLLLELVDWLRGKLGIRVRERAVPRRAKVWVALAVLALSFITGVPVFEAVSPIGFVNKGLLFGSVAGLWTFVCVVVLELFWARRVWCRSLCPLGGFYQALGRAGLVNVRIDHGACVGCGACKKVCLCDPEILDRPVAGKDAAVLAGDCMLCGRCVEACPVDALKISAGLDHYRGRR